MPRDVDLLVKDLNTFLRERLHEFVIKTDSGQGRTILGAEVMNAMQLNVHAWVVQKPINS